MEMDTDVGSNGEASFDVDGGDAHGGTDAGMDRRAFMRAAGELLMLCASVGLAACGDTGAAGGKASTTAPELPRALLELFPRQSLVLGERAAREHFGAEASAKLASRVAQAGALPDAAAARAWLREQLVADFAEGRVVLVDLWRLAELEALVLAVAAQAAP
jgi:hypothetical protein